MLIVPYIHKIIQRNNIKIHKISILTVGGKDLWEESNELDINTDILNMNDIYSKYLYKIGNNIILCDVDDVKTNVRDMYNWKEITLNENDMFCWRDYYLFVGSNDSNWLNISKKEKIGNMSVRNLLFSIINNKEADKIYQSV
jgi:hypothetical protein